MTMSHWDNYSNSTHDRDTTETRLMYDRDTTDVRLMYDRDE